METDVLAQILSARINFDEAPVRHPVMQVKVFFSESRSIFEETINEFLEKRNDNIIDIKFQATDKILAAMITYVK